MTKQQITWTRSLAGAYRHDETGFAIQQGESTNWFVYDAEDMIVASGRTLTLAKVAAKPLVIAAMQAKADAPVPEITVTRDDRQAELSITTTSEVTSFRGTAFVPNRCDARFFNGKLVSVSLGRLDENGWPIDDPAGPDGAELDVSYGGGELTAEYRAKLPQVVQDIIAHLETMER